MTCSRGLHATGRLPVRLFVRSCNAPARELLFYLVRADFFRNDKTAFGEDATFVYVRRRVPGEIRLILFLSSDYDITDYSEVPAVFGVGQESVISNLN